MEQDIAAGEVVFIVAENMDGRVIGFGAVAPNAGELRAVYVSADHSNHGIGSAILRGLETAAYAAGTRELCLDSSLNAEAFYAAHGFIAQDRGEHEFRSGAKMACVLMRKRLNGLPR